MHPNFFLIPAVELLVLDPELDDMEADLKVSVVGAMFDTVWDVFFSIFSVLVAVLGLRIQ